MASPAMYAAWACSNMLATDRMIFQRMSEQAREWPPRIRGVHANRKHASATCSFDNARWSTTNPTALLNAGIKLETMQSCLPVAALSARDLTSSASNARRFLHPRAYSITEHDPFCQLVRFA